MNLSDFKPASELVKNYGVKSLCYGAPGTAKTPLAATAPNALLVATEPGILSLKDSKLLVYEAYTPDRIREFFKWLIHSKEHTKFDTIAIDSVSQMAEIIAIDKLKSVKHGLKAFGEMASEIMEYLNFLYFMQYKHIYLIAKEATVTNSVFAVQNGIPIQTEVVKKVPYFPGKELNVKIPHLFDEILYTCYTVIPGIGETLAIRTKGNNEILARDRSGKLAEFEPHDLTALFNKCMQ